MDKDYMEAKCPVCYTLFASRKDEPKGSLCMSCLMYIQGKGKAGIREENMKNVKTLGELIDDRMEIYKTMEEDQKKADDVQVGGSHYKDMAVQPWAVMESVLTTEEFIGFLKGNIIKYAMRQGRKDSDDAGKLKHYQQKLREINGDVAWDR